MSLRIKISTPLTQYLLTESIPLEVVYENIGPDVAVFREPARTWEVALVTSVDHAQERVDPLGKLFYYRDQDKERRSIEDADDVTLQPNQRYPFVEDVGKRFPQSLGPGRVAVRVFDRSYTPALVSNELTLEVVLGQGSFERLFELAAEAPPPVDPHTQSSEDQNALERRRFAASLIEQFYPDLKLELPAPTLSAESKNQASVRAAKAWWSQHQGSAEVVQKLKQLNGQH